MASNPPRQLILLGAFAVVLYLSYQILQPFLAPIFLALILATLTAPTYEVMVQRLGGRRNLAALLVCIGLTVAIILPLFLLLLALGREANDLYTVLRRPEAFDGLRDWLDPAQNPLLLRLQQYIPIQAVDIAALRDRIGEVALPVLAGITAFLAGIFSFLFDYAITMMVLFFLLRDFEQFKARIKQFSPLGRTDERMFAEKFRSVTRATVIGNGLTASAQGLSMGVLFVILGIPNPVLWGTLGALLSLVPFVGMALIWVPWTIYLLFTGAFVRAAVLVVVQTVVVGSLDNVLRPLLMGSGLKMHTVLVLFSILGGLAYFGALGILFGPLTFALALTCLDFYFSLQAAETAAQPAEPVEPR